jgi:hypothetical protein
LACTASIVIAARAIFISGLAQFANREKAGHRQDGSDTFPASGCLPETQKGMAPATLMTYLKPAAANADRITTEGISDKTTGGFHVASAAAVGILVALGATWW